MSVEEIREIFAKVTERYEAPVQIGSRCEANTFYRLEDLDPADLSICASYIAERIVNVCQANLPQILIDLPGSFTGLAAELAKELAPAGEELEVITYQKLQGGNGATGKIKNADVVLVNDVITTARSCLEAHTQVTMLGARVLCWAALVDRTFGPGPVSVVASFTGEPVRLLDDLR